MVLHIKKMSNLRMVWNEFDMGINGNKARRFFSLAVKQKARRNGYETSFRDRIDNR